jgi:hypothetical protein
MRSKVGYVIFPSDPEGISADIGDEREYIRNMERYGIHVRSIRTAKPAILLYQFCREWLITVNIVLLCHSL